MDSPDTERTSVASGPNTGRRGRRAVLLLGSAAVVLAVAAALAVRYAPGPVIVALARPWLRSLGVQSEIDVLSVSDHAIAARVRLGDPRDPELTVDRVDVSYDLAGPWMGKPIDFTARRVVLLRPRLRLTVGPEGADFGQLGGLVRWAQAQPPSRAPLPDLRVIDGQLRLITPSGPLALKGTGGLAPDGAGALAGRVASFRQTLSGVSVFGEGGGFNFSTSGGRVTGQVMLGATRAEGRGIRVQTAAVALNGSFPRPDSEGRLVGPGRVSGHVDGLGVQEKGLVAAPGRLTVLLSGLIDADAKRQAFTGDLTLEATTPGLKANAFSMGSGAGHVESTALAVTHTDSGLSLRARGRGSLALAAIETDFGRLDSLTLGLTLANGEVDSRSQGLTAGGVLNGQLTTRGGMKPALVKRVAAAIPTVGGEQPYATPLASALAAFELSVPDWAASLADGKVRLDLGRPARLTAGTGAVFTVDGHGEISATQRWRANGAGRVVLAGGGLPSLNVDLSGLSASSGRFDSRLGVQAAFSVASISQGSMTLQATIASTPAAVRVRLDSCGTFGARRVDTGSQRLEDLTLRLCPGPGPLFDLGNSAWVSTGQFQDVGGRVTTEGVALDNGALDFKLSGDSNGLAQAKLNLKTASLSDTDAATRFKPLSLDGALALDRGVWRGAAHVATGGGRRLGTLTLDRFSPDGSGRIAIDAAGLDFAAGGLQPVDLTPLASGVRDAVGHVGFTGSLAWTGAGEHTSAGDLVASGLSFTGPAGRVEGLETRIHLTSLAPVVTLPAQRLSVAAIRTVTPVTDLSVVFDLDARRFRLSDLAGKFANGSLGLEPIDIPLSGDAPVTGALVLKSVDIGVILDASNLSDKVKIDAKVNGRIPFTAGPKGLTIAQGTLAAVAGGRLSISRSAFDGQAKAETGGGAAPPAAAAQTSFAQDFAYQAMENLSFDTLDATLNSQPHDRLGLLFHIKGRHDPPTPKRAVFSVADLLAGRALAKPVPLPSGTRIDLTLDTSLNFGDLVVALQGAWNDAVAPIREVRAAVPEPLRAATPKRQRKTP